MTEVVEKLDLRGTVQGQRPDGWEPSPVEVPRTEVMIHRLDIVEHPNADALELAVVGGVLSEYMEDTCVARGEHDHPMIVGGFRAVVPKGVYKTGDYALYIPEASVLPRALVEELGLVGRLSGAAKNRVKAVKLRGELSQGIVCRPESMQAVWHQFDTCGGFVPYCTTCSQILLLNHAEFFGIEKWVPRMPTALSGRVMQRGVSRIVPWIEIPNIKKVMKAFSAGEEVIATEKIHGTHCMITWDTLGNDGAGELLVSSKGIGKMGWDLVEDESNVYWRAVRQHKVEEFLRWLADKMPHVERFSLYGEVYGAGIQDLTYGVPQGTVQFVAFDLRLDGMWVSTDVFHNVIMASSLGPDHGVCLVPELYRGPYDYERLCAVAEGETVVGDGRHMREGLVLRPAVERVNGDGSRVIAKFISEAYLLRKGETSEFE